MRRYEAVIYDNGIQYGKDAVETYDHCQNTPVRSESWTSWFVHCSNCFCLCDEQVNSDRHFSLREAVSDIDKNR